uniref:Uncharacterized protein n=1 Tax=Wolbachia endosymbiont of Aleurodicus floccissimus TaxID=2152762 RepID=A0A3B0IXD0_9RICK
MLNSIHPTWLNFVIDKELIHQNYFSKLLDNNVIESLNNIDLNLFSTLINGIINKDFERQYKDQQNTLLYLSDLLKSKENIKKFNSTSHEFLNILIRVSDNRGYSTSIGDIGRFFNFMTQDRLDRLYANLNLLVTLANTNILRSAQEIRYITETFEENNYRYEGDIEKLSNHLDLLTILIDKNIITGTGGGGNLGYFFYITQNNGRNIDRLYSLNLNVLTALIDVGVIKDIRNLDVVCDLDEHDVESLNILGSNLLTILIGKRGSNYCCLKNIIQENIEYKLIC